MTVAIHTLDHLVAIYGTYNSSAQCGTRAQIQPPEQHENSDEQSSVRGTFIIHISLFSYVATDATVSWFCQCVQRKSDVHLLDAVLDFLFSYFGLKII